MSEHFVGPQLQAYLDGELAQADAGRVKAHCERCEACASELNELRAMRELLVEAVPAEGPLRPVWPGLVHRLRERSEPRLGRAFGFASAAACAAGIAMGVMLGSGSPVSVPEGAGLSSQGVSSVSIGSLWSSGDNGSLLNIYLPTDSGGEDE